MPPPYYIKNWQETVAAKQFALKEAIPEQHRLPASLLPSAEKHQLLPSSEAVLNCGILSGRDREITDVDDAELLVKYIVNRKYTSAQVIEAFCKRASIAQQTANCLTEIMYDEAMARALWLDHYLETEGKPFGILHGLPVSLKDCYDVKDVATTSGLVSWIPNVATKNSSIADGLLAAGAVLYVKTNTSQALLMVESINNIFGTTRNPFNLDLSAGGSSGGEAALVASKGAILGSATDGGGSIRFPASFCGLWGLKCSKGRMPSGGISTPRDGNRSVNAGLGPLARNVASMELWLRAQLERKPWDYDPGCIPMPWNIAEAKRPTKKLVFGILWDDGVVHPTPPVERALREMVSLLRSAGHTTINLPADEMKALHRQATACAMKCNVQSGGATIMEHISASGEPVVPRTATGSSASYLTTKQVFDNHLMCDNISAKYNNLWTRFTLDTILAPTAAHPAPPHGKYVSNAYATVFDVLDYATGNVPVTVVKDDKDIASPEWYARTPYERIEEQLFPYDWGDKEMQQLYTGPEVYKSAPVGLQIVCRRLREEKVVSILKELELLLEAS